MNRFGKIIAIWAIFIGSINVMGIFAGIPIVKLMEIFGGYSREGILKLLQTPFANWIQYGAEILTILLLLLLNHVWIKQKILLKRYAIWKSIGLLALGLVLVGMRIYSIAKGEEHTTGYLLAIGLGAITVGIAEELAFRGLIFGQLLKFGKSLPFAIIMTNLLFCLMHGMNILSGATATETLIQVLYTFPMGVLFTAIYIRSHSLVIPILLHFMIDAQSIIGSGGSAISHVSDWSAVPENYLIFGGLALIYLLVFGKKQRESFVAELREPKILLR